MFGSRTISINGDTLRPATPFTSIGVPLVFDQIVMMPGMPRQTKSNAPEISASFITSLERNVALRLDVAEARRLGVLLDHLLVLHHHELHVGDAELLGDADAYSPRRGRDRPDHSAGQRRRERDDAQHRETSLGSRRSGSPAARALIVRQLLDAAAPLCGRYTQAASERRPPNARRPYRASRRTFMATNGTTPAALSAQTAPLLDVERRHAAIQDRASISSPRPIASSFEVLPATASCCSGRPAAASRRCSRRSAASCSRSRARSGSTASAIERPGPDRMMVFQEFDQLLPWKTVLRERDVSAAGQRHACARKRADEQARCTASPR